MVIKRIGVLTSGGDSPGMNAAVRSVVRLSLHHNLEVMGVLRGLSGLIEEEMKPLDHRSVSNIISRGGTILKTARCEEFLTKEGQKKAVENIRKNKIDGLILIGGDGTYRAGHILSCNWQVPCIGVPATIDNDIKGTDYTIGSDTAVNTALEAIDRIRDTATSLERIFVVEVMGRLSGFIALEAGLAGGCEDVLIPEKDFDLDLMSRDIVEGNSRGKVSWIIIIAEGIGRAEDIANKITEKTDLETRVVVLGHIQRGGIPTAQDRIFAARLGAAAVDCLINNESDKAVGIVADKINVVDLEFAAKGKKPNIKEIYKLIRILT